MALTKVIGSGLGAVTQDGAATFNEGSADVDFRIESNNDANAFFVEGETGNVAIGTNDPTVQDAGMRMLHIHNSATDGTGRSSLKLTNGDSTLAASRGAIITLDDAAQLTIGAFESAGKTIFTTGGTTTRVTIDENGIITKPYQPSFLVQPSTAQNNIGEGTQIVVAFGTERFDVGSNFASNTFTAPVTGKYLLNFALFVVDIDNAPSYFETYLVTSNRSYYNTIDPRGFDQDPAYWTFTNCVVADMDANDTSSIQFNIHNGGTVQSDIQTLSHFSGYLLG